MIIECRTTVGLIGDTIASIPFILEQTKHGEVIVTGDFAEPVKALCAGLPFRFSREQVHADKVYDLNIQNAWKWDNDNGWKYYMAHTFFGLHGLPIPDFSIVPFYEYPCSVAPGIVISPFARSDGNFTKRWPVENWQEIIRHFKDKVPVYILGNSDDDMEEYWRVGAHPIQNWDFPHVLGLMRSAKVFVSIDTGTSHLAILAGLHNHILLYPNGLPRMFAESPYAVMLKGVTNRHIHVDMVVSAIEAKL